MPFTKEDIKSIIAEVVGEVQADKVEESQRKSSESLTNATAAAAIANSPQRLAKSDPEDDNFVTAKYIRCMVRGNNDPERALKEAIKLYGEEATVVKALMSSEPESGGYTIAPGFSNDVIEYLRPKAVVRSMTPNVIPMPVGSFTIPKQTGGATAEYVGENRAIGVVEPTFGQLKLVFRKLATMVPVSNDFIRYSNPGIDRMITNDVALSLAVREDAAFIRDDGTEHTPKGFRHWAANTANATSPTNLANVTTDLATLILYLEESNVAMSNVGWLFHPQIKQYLMSVRDTNGNFAFRDEMLAGRLWGYPFKTTTQIPNNLGVGADESEIYLVDFADVIIGEGERIIIDASGEASYSDGTNTISAFQNDQTIIRAIAEHDMVVRHDASVAVLTGVKWTP